MPVPSYHPATASAAGVCRCVATSTLSDQTAGNARAAMFNRPATHVLSVAALPPCDAADDRQAASFQAEKPSNRQSRTPGCSSPADWLWHRGVASPASRGVARSAPRRCCSCQQSARPPAACGVECARFFAGALLGACAQSKLRVTKARYRTSRQPAVSAHATTPLRVSGSTTPRRPRRLLQHQCEPAIISVRETACR